MATTVYINKKTPHRSESFFIENESTLLDYHGLMLWHKGFHNGPANKVSDSADTEDDHVAGRMPPSHYLRTRR